MPSFPLRRLAYIVAAILLPCLLMTCKQSASPDLPVNTVSRDHGGGVADLSGKVTGWRDDNRTGVSSETGLLKSWPEGGPSLVWSNTELPEGNSSVAIGNGTIYLTGMESEQDVLIALDQEGKIKWKTPYGRSWDGSYSESRCTPAIDGDRVYVSSGIGDLACVDALNGKIIWQSRASELYKGNNGNWGIAESLIVDSLHVYYTPGGNETTTVALNKQTGALVWKSRSLSDKASYVSPILVNYAGKRMLINATLRHLYGVDVENGKILWSVAFPSEAKWGDHIVCVTPLFKDGMVYITEGYNAGGMMVRLNQNGTDAKIAWTEKTMDTHTGGVVEIDGKIYGSGWISNRDGNWCCVDWNTGKLLYEESWQSKGSIIAADGMLYLYAEKSGIMALAKPNPYRLEVVSSFSITEGTGPHWAHPVIHNGYLFVRHGKALLVYNITGSL